MINNYDFIFNYFVEREGAEILSTLMDVDLIESGLLDSLDMIELAVIIEKNTGIKVVLADSKTFNSMRRIQSIIDMLEK